jgi:hypothetical protein
MKKIKKFLFFVIAIFFLFTLQSCNPRENSYYQDLQNKRFELLKDSFLFVWKSGNYDIDIPGSYSGIPVTIEDYIRFPESWQNTKNYINKYGNLTLGKEQIIGILKKGTIVHFVGIDKSYSWGYFDTCMYPLVEIENGPFKGQISRISLIELFSTESKPIISEYIKQID